MYKCALGAALVRVLRGLGIAYVPLLGDLSLLSPHRVPLPL